MNNSIKSYQDLEKHLVAQSQKRVLLHCCCGPCSSACLERLNAGFKVDLFFNNPNINTLDEYEKRAAELKRIVGILSPDSLVVIDEYRPKDFAKAIIGLESLGEKSKRCYECYKLRMRAACIYAKSHGYDYFTTTLSISPHKNSDWINEIGFQLADEFDMPFIYSNFKLKDGYKRSIELSKQYELYRQNYCGCIYSKKERELLDE